MAWSCEEKGGDMCRAKGASNGATRKEEEGETTETVRG